MVVAAGADDGCLVTEPLLQLEAEDATPELERTVDVSHSQVDMADVDTRIDTDPRTISRPACNADGHPVGSGEEGGTPWGSSPQGSPSSEC
jgi:hypothetical protein